MKLLIGLTLLVTSCHGFLLDEILSGTGSEQKPLASQNYRYHEILDENYELYWDFNNTHITFETRVQTNGYIGFGISPNGAMLESDVVIGWVKDGVAHFKDHHVLSGHQVKEDTSQDWTLLGASEIGNFTILKMVRKLDTCDTEDRAILTGTTRVIYSYHPSDPVSQDSIPYHGPETRGTKSLLLLDPPTKETSGQSASENLVTLDILNENYTVPGKDTTYRCNFLKLPDLKQKHHLIGYEPIIQQGHEGLVHHILIYYCTKPIDDKLVGTSYDCTDVSSLPLEVFQFCYHTIVAWAIGGTAFNYPSHVGHSLGAPGDPVYLRLETHYDNPGLRSDFVDNSGIRLILTTDLRQHDAGVIELGVMVDQNQIIPPHQPYFVSRGLCHAECLAKGLGDQEIHIFATLLHSHLLGRKIHARHFRNGTEISPLNQDNNYDFNYQEMRALQPERTLRKGDSVLTECIYDSSKRTNITYGGLSSRDEMCLTFVWYYPKIPVTFCTSRPEYRLPKEYAQSDISGWVKQSDWTKPNVYEEFKKMLDEGSLINYCMGDTKDFQMSMTMSPALNITDEYQRPDVCSNN